MARRPNHTVTQQQFILFSCEAHLCVHPALMQSLTACVLWQPQAKQTSYEELSAGQASQMARNETEIDRSTEEMEDLEETLNESIAESIKSRQRQVWHYPLRL